MKKFAYEARDQASNKIAKATLQADSENAAAHLLVHTIKDHRAIRGR
jgi:hypothetical protein